MANTKIPVELSSTPGIVDNSDATAITIGSNEKVGIGTTSTDHQLSVNAADYDGIQLLQGGTDTGYIGVYHDGSSTGRIYLGGLSSVDIQTGNGGATDGTTRIRVDSDGLKFGSDTAAANALDDYEEGTWTPQITASAGSAGTAAYSNQYGRYTKIGNKVFFEFQVVMTNKGSWSASTRVLGFPFTAASSASIAFAVSRFPDDTIGAGMIAGELQPSTSFAFFTTGSRLDSLHNISDVDTGYYLNGAGHYTIQR